jgi:hypothetical protein
MQNLCKERIKALAFTVKEINSTSGLDIYNTAIISNTRSLPIVQEVMSRAFENSSVLFVGDRSVGKQGTSQTMGAICTVCFIT